MLGKRLRDLREEHGYSQHDLAQKLGKSQNTISSWETGRTVPKMKELNLLCNLYNCSYQHITGVRQQDPTDIKFEDILIRLTTLSTEELKRLKIQINFLMDQQEQYQKMEDERQRLLEQLNRVEEYQKKIMSRTPKSSIDARNGDQNDNH